MNCTQLKSRISRLFPNFRQNSARYFEQIISSDGRLSALSVALFLALAFLALAKLPLRTDARSSIWSFIENENRNFGNRLWKRARKTFLPLPRHYVKRSKSRYVVFNCYGKDGDCISKAWENYFQNFLPQSGLESKSSADFEVYFDDGDPDLMCELWIPIISPVKI